MQGKLIVFVCITTSLLLSGCAVNLTAEQEAFKEECNANKHAFMQMTPLANGAQTSNESCWGCMPDMMNHICSPEEYEKVVNAPTMK